MRSTKRTYAGYAIAMKDLGEYPIIKKLREERAKAPIFPEPEPEPEPEPVAKPERIWHDDPGVYVDVWRLPNGRFARDPSLPPR